MQLEAATVCTFSRKFAHCFVEEEAHDELFCEGTGHAEADHQYSKQKHESNIVFQKDLPRVREVDLRSEVM